MSVCQIRIEKSGYESKVILEDIRMDCVSGKITALLGPNGSGKSTLFKSLMKNEAWVQGSCLLDDEDLLLLSPKKRARKIALLAQENVILPGYRALDILLSGFYPHLDLFMPVSDAMKKKAEHLAEELGIKDLLDMDFTHLSAGQKQMVLLGRTLLQDAEIILMDEFDNTLDFEHKHEMMRYFSNVVAKQEKIGIMISHDASFVLANCECIYLMYQGKLLEKIEPLKEKREAIENKLRRVYPHMRLIEAEKQYYPIYEI